MTHFAQNLQVLRKNKGLKQSDFEDIGIKRTTWNNYELNKSEPDIATILRISSFFNINTDRLLGEDLSKDVLLSNNIDYLKTYVKSTDNSTANSTAIDEINLIFEDENDRNKTRELAQKRIDLLLNKLISNESESHNNTLISELNNYKSDLENKKESIPLVELRAAAGFGSGAFSLSNTDIKDNYVIPKFRNKKVDFMIEIEGSSMYPKYNSGDVVACTIIRENTYIQWNKTHVIATKDQGLMVKRIKKGNTDLSLLMVSDNPSYDPFEVPKDEITGIAMVVGVIRLE